MTDITRVLSAIESGDGQAVEELWRLVYEQLRSMAAGKISRENPGLTLSPTVLVHEAYLRLLPVEESADPLAFENRRHFFGAAAEAMRRILIDNARRKRSGKRGGGKPPVEYDLSLLPLPEVSEDVVALDDALQKLAESKPKIVELVKLRYFTGLTIQEAAEMLAISPRTAGDWWAYARAWLLTELQSPD